MRAPGSCKCDIEGASEKSVPQVASSRTRLAWAARAEELAAWAEATLVNRIDAWGGYYCKRTEGGWQTCPTTNPAVKYRHKVLLTRSVLVRHFRAWVTSDVIGLHTTSPENTSLWGATEVDWHGEGSTAPRLNAAAAIGWYGKLKERGFHPLLTDSNGKGGFHLRILFRSPIPTPQVFSFLQWLVSDFARYGLPASPELFPKQERIGAGRYGNWLRCPGRHHTADHWSRVWDGERWLEAMEAINFILGLEGGSPGLLKSDMTAPQPAPCLGHRPMPAALRHSEVDHLSSRIRSYLNKLPSGLGEGQRRDDYAYVFASWLIRDLALPDYVALVWLEKWDARNAVAKGTDRLREILSNVHKYGKRPLGCGRSRTTITRI